MRRGLGKGLSQLVAQSLEAPAGGVSEAPLSAISANSKQPRTRFDQEPLEELAQSIRQHGVLMPLVVREIKGGKYEIIAGERRFRAAKLAGLKRVPISIRDAGAQEVLELSLIENIQREDISPMECARAYKRLSEEFKLSQEEIAEKLGKSRTVVANTLRLLKLPLVIREGLEAEKITEGHARALLMAASEAQQVAIYEATVARQLSVREVEQLARATTIAQRAAPQKKEKPEPKEWNDIRDLLSRHFATDVHLMPIGKGKGGKLVVDFYSDEDLQRLLDLFGVTL